MTIHNLQYFIDIVDTGSISAAARKNYIAQQSMSAYLKKLEAHYRVQLIVREQPLYPTEQGQQLYEAAKRIHLLLTEFEASLSTNDPPLVIGLTNSSTPSFLADLIAALNAGRTRSLEVRVCPNCHNTPKTEDVDIYIGTDPSPECYDIVPLVDDRLAVAVSENLLTACFGSHTESLKQKLLASGHLFLLQRLPFSVCNDTPEMELLLQNANVIVRSNNYDLLNNMCIQEKSASIIWLDCAHREFAAHKSILIVPLSEPAVTRTLCIYYDKGRVLSPVAQQFVTAAKQYFSETP